MKIEGVANMGKFIRLGWWDDKGAARPGGWFVMGTNQRNLGRLAEGLSQVDT